MTIPPGVLRVELVWLAILFSSFPVGASAQGFYYELETVASTGGLTSEGDTIAAFRSTSINESGTVAMAASLAGSSRQGIFISGTGNVSLAVGPASDARSTTSVSITADGKVTAHEQATAGTPRPSAIRVWDSASPATTPPPLITNTGAGVTVLLTPVSRANDGTVLFPAFSPRRLYLNTTGAANQKIDIGPMAPSGQAWVASGGSYVLREGSGGGGSLSVDPPSGPRRVVATAGVASWPVIGDLPGISDSGKVIAFAGEAITGSPGIFLWIDEPGNPDFADPIRIQGYLDAREGLGYDDGGEAVVFGSFDMTQRVGVQHREAGPGGLEGDEIIVSFIATPASPSFTNPHTGDPMLFAAQAALWVVHLTPSRDLTGTQPIRLDVKTSPMPVVQVGDVIGGETITAIFADDPLAFAERNTDGFERVTIGPADHYVGFEVETASGMRKVIRASQFDSDFDGLFDHWEKIGGGLDVDRDGTIDLALHEYGADPYRKDAFFEIDWSAPYQPAPGLIASMEPQAVALQHLVDRFAAAPVANPVGPPGISAHIDAGPSLSLNMPGTATLAGGDVMVDPLGAGVVTVIYGNDLDYQPVPPGTTDDFGNPIIERSAKVMRDLYFGQHERNARELVFRHVMIGYIIGADYMADLVGLAEAPEYASRPFLPAESFTDLDDDGEWFEGDVFIDGNGNGTYDAGETFINLRGGEGYDPPEPFVDSNGNGYRDGALTESSRSMPGNSILIGHQGRHSTENGTSPVYFPQTGVPDRVPAPPALFLLSTLYHEVGHTMTLLHGGSDNWTGGALPTPKPGYLSIMNYRYGPYPASDGTFILDFSSGGGGGDFNDWAIFKMDFARYFDSLGDQRLSSRYELLEEGHAHHDHVKLNVTDLEIAFGAAGPPLPPRIEPRPPIGQPGDLLDPDGDGLDTLVELGLGLDPEVADAAGVLIVEADRSATPTLFSLTYPRDTSRSDLTVEVRFSPDLVQWTSAGISENVLSTQGAIETVKATVEGDPQGRGFFRIRVSRK